MTNQSHLSLTTVFPVKLKKTANTGGGEYHGPCPFCHGTDRFRVNLRPDDSPNPLWLCNQCGKGGDYIAFTREYYDLSYQEACEKLGLTPDAPPQQTTRKPKTAQPLDLQAAPIDDKPQPVIQVATTKRKYLDLEDYALQHGVDPDALRKAGWQETTKDGRPALSFPVAGGQWTRYRFIDGAPKMKPYTNDTGFQKCWYGLDRAINMATGADLPLVYCNGEISTISAQERGIPAFSVAGGGEHRLSPDMLKDLQSRWTGDYVIALDCDDTGRTAAAAIGEQLGHRAMVLDLGLSDGGDLGDFCYQTPNYTLQTFMSKVKAIKLQPATTDIVSSRTSLERFKLRLDMKHTIRGMPIQMPFERLHQFGGLCEVLLPGKIFGVVGPSGTGKTAFLGTLNDLFNANGQSGFWYGSEWTPDEYNDKRIERQGGLSQQKIAEYELYKAEASMGKTVRAGSIPSDDDFAQTEDLIKKIERWPGETFFFPPQHNLTATLEQMRDLLSDYRRSGRLITYVIFDYIQLLRADTVALDGDNRHEVALELIKQFCTVNYIVGIVASQITKTASKTAKDDGNAPDGIDMLYVRDDKLNGVATLGVKYVDDVTDQGVIVGRKATQYGRIRVTKNSTGRTGSIDVVADLERSRWLVDHDWSTLRRGVGRS